MSEEDSIRIMAKEARKTFTWSGTAIRLIKSTQEARKQAEYWRDVAQSSKWPKTRLPWETEQQPETQDK